MSDSGKIGIESGVMFSLGLRLVRGLIIGSVIGLLFGFLVLSLFLVSAIISGQEDQNIFSIFRITMAMAVLVVGSVILTLIYMVRLYSLDRRRRIENRKNSHS